jgi:hypothetical protein
LTRGTITDSLNLCLIDPSFHSNPDNNLFSSLTASNGDNGINSLSGTHIDNNLIQPSQSAPPRDELLTRLKEQNSQGSRRSIFSPLHSENCKLSEKQATELVRRYIEAGSPYYEYYITPSGQDRLVTPGRNYPHATNDLIDVISKTSPK